MIGGAMGYLLRELRSDPDVADANRATAACGLLVGLLTTLPGMCAAALRQHAVEIAGPAAPPPAASDEDGSGGGRR